MTELVINAPDLQTNGQRLGAAALTVTGWLLWCYIFFPLVTLSCWLVDNEVCSQWVNFAGGYLQLQHMMWIYLQTIAALTLSWCLWVSYNLFRQRRVRRAPLLETVGVADLCDEFQVLPQQLSVCRASRYADIHFDDEGRITSLAER